jgi:hypothetical protein
MSLDLAHEKLGWPTPEEIRNPSGEGARIFAELAQAKIERAISRHPDAASVKIGVLLRNPQATDTEAPLAIVAEFNGNASDQTLHALQRLAWNFSHSPTVVTIEPDLLRVWTCCEPPEDQRDLNDYVVEKLATDDLVSSHPSNITKRVSQVLHWVNLVSGQFFRDHAERFRRDQRADQMLLGNLRHVRHMLHNAGLKDDDVCHDLLARIVFVQFLFDRKDTKGNSALNQGKLAALREAGILHKEHMDLPSILEDYEETYRLFDWLNSKFNGDLFPGKGSTPQERERGWSKEREHVKPIHLDLLRDFIKGDMDMPKGQLCLWPQYSFDAIPLEFISSIYEAFVKERAAGEGIYYTPPHLVDFILDRVLPWDSDKWNLKVLDPSCGSGVFLVKAFQRLIHRWRKAHPDQTIRAENLRGLLERNLFGVDKDPHAVLVASFSLYLAMCDEIDPKYYWSQVVFPAMREHRLVNSDFFEEDRIGFRTKEDAASYDLVIGNAPWGEKLLTEAAEQWAKDTTHQWPVANKGIGTLFLPKAAALTKSDGKISMIQSASSLLFNRSGKACDFRKKFFIDFRVDEVVNLSALRFKVFNRKAHSTQTSIAPPCVITFKPQPPNNERFAYISPKQVEDLADEFDIIIDPTDSKSIHPDDAANDPEVWTALMWGNRRDWAFVQRLHSPTSLAKLRDSGKIVIREGLIPSNNGNFHPDTPSRMFWKGDSFPTSSFIQLNTSQIEVTEGIKTHRKTSLKAFDLPQLTIKQSWQTVAGRFTAMLTPSEVGEGVLFTQSYLSAHSLDGETSSLDAACLSYNSILSVYFLLLTSSRFASYRPEPLVEELLRVPVPEPQAKLLDGLQNVEDIDRRIREAFNFKDAEWVLIEDLFNITLSDFKGDAKSPGRQRTQRRNRSTEEPELRSYCEYFIRVLKAGFGQDKNISASIFHETSKDLLPYRLVAFELNGLNDEQIRTETLDTPDLLAELETLNQTWLRSNKSSGGSIYHQRVARVYDHRGNTPAIFILKPDACRYWTRSMGLLDADEVSADFARWQSSTRAK